ncbi:hypothetical protein QFC24_002352 [Naganishia onofrii]|uniref:Uncharacterized protein n=1 Tax=Naganishia onofrii TaxID=1851511 RepID=A0ACC2XR05_9TREE|nr:hypothetical protein QFC24_002352 [Naganishia onofrii]
MASSSPSTKAGSRWSFLWSHQSSNNPPPTGLTKRTVSAASRAGTSEDKPERSDQQSGVSTGSSSERRSVATDIRIPLQHADGTELDVYHLTENGLEKQGQMSLEEMERLMEDGVLVPRVLKDPLQKEVEEMVKQIMERAPPTDTTKANDKGGSGDSQGGLVPLVPVVVVLGVTLCVMIVGSGWYMLGGGKEWTKAKWDKHCGNKSDVVQHDGWFGN